jgi:heme/copper-type cytochrome/quinol oxidase subunit 3
MQIPYEVTARPDTGLYNAKLGIWLFLASEVMLFGGLFSAYVFLRLGAEDGYWPHGLLNVPVGALNTGILIISSVTVVVAWASLKMRKFIQFKIWLGVSIICGIVFLVVKLGYEWPQKFEHFGAFIKQDELAKYEPYLGNKYLKEKNLEPRVEISGHLLGVEITVDPAKKENLEEFLKAHELEMAPIPNKPDLQMVKHEAGEEVIRPGIAEDLEEVKLVDGKMEAVNGAKIVAFDVGLDPVNAEPTDPESDRPHFWYKGPTDTPGRIEAKDVESWSAFTPKHSPYFAVYFTITGLHGLHVLVGVIIMIYFWLPIPGGASMFKRNPEHLANRVEVVGLFWHFVDLIWIFVFPIFYLL